MKSIFKFFNFKAKARAAQEAQEEMEYQQNLISRNREEVSKLFRRLLDENPGKEMLVDFNELCLEAVTNYEYDIRTIEQVIEARGIDEAYTDIKGRIEDRRLRTESALRAARKLKEDRLMKIKYSVMAISLFLVFLGASFTAGMFFGAKRAGWKVQPPTAIAEEIPGIPGTPAQEDPQVDIGEGISTEDPSDTPVVVKPVPGQQELKSPVELPWWLHYGGTADDLEIDSIETVVTDDFPNGITSVIVSNPTRGLIFNVRVVRGEIFRISYFNYAP